MGGHSRILQVAHRLFSLRNPLLKSSTINSDAAYDKILLLATQLRVDGYISRVNPDKYPGVTSSKYDKLLLELSRRDLAALPHPTLMKVPIPQHLPHPPPCERYFSSSLS